jgi:hypothetical protein
MATLMTIRPHQDRTATAQATFELLASDAPVINPAGMLPGELEILADKVICNAMEDPIILPATELLLLLVQGWGMEMGAALTALHEAAADGEHLIVHM